MPKVSESKKEDVVKHFYIDFKSSKTISKDVIILLYLGLFLPMDR